MITQKTKYALKAMMVLADAAAIGDDALRIEEIAQRSATPKRFLEQILLQIRNAGMIGSRRGRSGGYMLIREPATISIGELLRLIDGPIAPLPCLSRTAYQRCEDCPDEDSCRVRNLFSNVFYAYLLMIESLTLADLVGAPALLDGIAAPPAPLA